MEKIAAKQVDGVVDLSSEQVVPGRKQFDGGVGSSPGQTGHYPLLVGGFCIGFLILRVMCKTVIFDWAFPQVQGWLRCKFSKEDFGKMFVWTDAEQPQPREVVLVEQEAVLAEPAVQVDALFMAR